MHASDRSGALRRPGRRRGPPPGPPGPPPGPPGPPKRNTTPPGIGPSGPIQPSVPLNVCAMRGPGFGPNGNCSTRWNLSGQREVELEVAGHVLLAHDAAVGAFEAHRLERRDLGVAANRLAHLREHRQRLRIARRRGRGGSRRRRRSGRRRGLGRGRLGEAQARSEERRREDGCDTGPRKAWVRVGMVGMGVLCQVWAGGSVRRRVVWAGWTLPRGQLLSSGGGEWLTVR